LKRASEEVGKAVIVDILATARVINACLVAGSARITVFEDLNFLRTA